MFEMILNDILFFSIPVVVIGFFGISLYRYLSAKKRNKASPDTFSAEEMKKRKLMMIVSSIAAGVLLLVVIGFIGLIFMAIAFM